MLSPKQPLTAATANPNAATAAAAVFKRQSVPSLSAAAAAAALRARPHTPTNVAGVQTKRTVHRSGSVSSSNTVQDGFSRPGLQRRGSSASMTERTFRSPSPSPHRPASAHGSFSGHGGVGRDMPPVPALPRDLDAASMTSVTSGTSAQSQARKTAIGISGTPVRVASQRLGQDVAPTWFGAAQVGDSGNVRRIDPAMASPPSSPPQPAVEERANEGQRPSSPSSSINFSYPARVRIGSPPVSPEDKRDSMEFFGRGAASQGAASSHQSSRSKQANRPSSSSSAGPVSSRPSSALSERSLVYDPHSRRMVPREEVPEEIWEKQATSHKKNQMPNKAGSHLSRGTMGRTQVHVPEEQRRMDSPSDRSVLRETVSLPKTKPVQKDRVQQSSREPTFAQNSAVLALGPKERSREATQTAQPMRRQPSVVKEEPEPESEAESSETEITCRQQDMMSALDRIPSRPQQSSTLIRPSDSEVQAAATVEKRRSAPAVGFVAPVSPPRQPSPVAAEHVVLAAPTEPKTRIATSRHGLQETGHERGHSASPVRQTHFGPVLNTLTVKHSPPPRSISPRKSALKHQSPPRASSPTDTNSEASAPRDELTVPRKKPVRVSFDDEHTVVVGESATTRNRDESPVPSSPQNNPSRRPWYSNITRVKQKGAVSLDDDEVMKPRPALPSFGSVRVKKPRELQNGDAERPLVRPSAETVYSPITPSTPAESPVRAEVPGSSQVEPESLGLGVSNDVAGIQSRRNAANISKYREPLPPIVTSVEGSEYMHDTLSSSDVEERQALQHAHIEAQSHEEAVSRTGSMAQPPEPESAVVMAKIPSIAVTLPSPAIGKEPMVHAIDAHVPGGFPEEDTDVSASEPSQAVEQGTSHDAAGSTGKTRLDPLVEDDDARKDTRARATISASPSQSPLSSDQETDNDSIYSDAYEDISEVGENGFQSLNAVLGGPVVNITASQSAPALHEKTFQPPRFEHTCSNATTVVEHQASQETPVPDEWEKAKAYWRGLTADKRAQLEREARDDAAMDADVEETKPEAKPRRRKSTEQRVSARQSLEQRQQQQQQQQQQQRVQNPERSYMIRPGSKWTEQQDVSILDAPPLRTTMRPSRQQKQNGQKSEAGVEKSRMRQSMRGNESAPGHAAQRPSRAKEVPSSHPAPGKVVQATKTASRRLPTVQTPALRRRGSDSSESSFIRARSGNNVQASVFRGSMRSSAMSTGQPEPSSKRKLLRALSPSRSAFRRASDPPPVAMAMAGKPAIRQSLRDSSVERKSNGMHMPSFGRSSGNKGSRVKSRFGDSSDDDVVLPVPVLPTPTTNLTKQTRIQSSDASTALLEEDEVSEEVSDSSDEEAPASKDRKTQQTALALAALNEAQALRQARSGRGSIGSAQTSPVLVGTGATAPAGISSGGGGGGKSARRRSFMAVLRRRMSGSGAGVGASRPEVMDSAARRDTKLERSAEELRDMRAASSEKASSRSPKLQRRLSGVPTTAPSTSRLFSRRWGAHQEKAEAAVDMSGAAGGGSVDYEREIMVLNRAAVGSLGTRSLSTGNLMHVPVRTWSPLNVNAVTAADAAQPKKFGALRRMFRLDD